MRIPYDPKLDLTNGFTIAMWFSLDPSTGQALISRDYGENPEDENTFIIMQSIWCGDDNSLYFGTPETLPLCGQASIQGRKWQHFAATWDGTLKKFFVNGQVAATQGTSAVYFDEHDIILGANEYGDRISAPFTGVIDELRFYERALEPAEVLRLPGYPVNE